MILVEKHVIDKNHRLWSILDEICLLSKNLYNAANYIRRQEFIAGGKITSAYDLISKFKDQSDYQSMPRKVSQQVILQMDQNWKSFFAANKEFKNNPSKFNGRPRLPYYKDKESGRNVTIFTDQTLSKPMLKKGIIKLSGFDIEFHTKVDAEKINQVRIVPRINYYVIEVVYEEQSLDFLDNTNYAAIDIGLNNLATITSNQIGFVPFLINGRPLKSINQFYNKQLAYFQSRLDGNRKSSKKIQKLHLKRMNKVNDYLHKASSKIVSILKDNHISILVIGKNEGWKQDINIGKRNNQNFVQIPHARFIQMLEYKCSLNGIRVILTEESYTSKCSFIDNEPICKHEVYMGKRIARGLFRANSGFIFNADVNGSYNIMRKAIPNAFANGIEGVVVHPISLVI